MSDEPDIEGSDLDALVRRVDPDRWLSSRFIADEHRRADVIALYAFDYELTRAPKVASNALMGEIRLTWWAEALDEIFEQRPVRRHPTAQALAAAVSRRSLERAPLEAMIEARYRELDKTPMSPTEAASWASDTAGAVAVLAAQILDPEAAAEAARSPGVLWVLARRGEATPMLRTEARGGARRLSVAAFPAVAHAALATGRPSSQIEKRLRLTWAVATGRI